MWTGGWTSSPGATDPGRQHDFSCWNHFFQSDSNSNRIFAALHLVNILLDVLFTATHLIFDFFECITSNLDLKLTMLVEHWWIARVSRFLPVERFSLSHPQSPWRKGRSSRPPEVHRALVHVKASAETTLDGVPPRRPSKLSALCGV